MPVRPPHEGPPDEERTMNEDKIMAWLEAERLSVADFLEGLDENE
ncbi:hypothetical protein [Spirillospora sp. NPDC047279]